MHQEWAGRVDVYGVAWAGDESSFRDFVDRHGLTFPQWSDPDGAVYDHFGVPVQPAFVFIDDDGTARTEIVAMDHDELESELQSLVDT